MEKRLNIDFPFLKYIILFFIFFLSFGLNELKKPIFAHDGEINMRFSVIFVKTKLGAEWILQELNAGADFAEMARKYSIGPEKEEGGDIGYFAPGDMMDWCQSVQAWSGLKKVQNKNYRDIFSISRIQPPQTGWPPFDRDFRKSVVLDPARINEVLNLKIGQHVGIIETSYGYSLLLKTDEKSPHEITSSPKDLKVQDSFDKTLYKIIADAKKVYVPLMWTLILIAGLGFAITAAKAELRQWKGEVPESSRRIINIMEFIGSWSVYIVIGCFVGGPAALVAAFVYWIETDGWPYWWSLSYFLPAVGAIVAMGIYFCFFSFYVPYIAEYPIQDDQEWREIYLPFPDDRE